MSYLIDGHNLIPHMPGMSLKDIDDEQQLVSRLSAFCAAQQKNAEVYFDQAPPGFAPQRRFGRVTAHFVRSGTTADEAIMARLRQLKKAARNYTVVSSDRQVTAAAREVHAKVMSSESFSSLIQDTAARSIKAHPEQAMSEEELARWEALFNHPQDDNGT